MVLPVTAIFLVVGMSDTGYFNYGIVGLQCGVVNGQKG
jgi:hypothetical protein